MARHISTRRPIQDRAISASEVMDLLAPEYGPIDWQPRYSPAAELVYTILSQHTSDVNSTRAFENLMKTFGSLEAIVDAPVGQIEDAIRSGGLSKIKAPRIKAILRQVYDKVGSYDISFLGDMSLEEAKAWLRDLPGVGPKTAAIVLCFSLGMPAMPVDTHIHRVAKRLGLIGRKITAEKAHYLLEAQIPPGDIFPFHLYLIKHGRQVCKALRPQCDHCVLTERCPSTRLDCQPPKVGP